MNVKMIPCCVAWGNFFSPGLLPWHVSNAVSLPLQFHLLWSSLSPTWRNMWKTFKQVLPESLPCLQIPSAEQRGDILSLSPSLLTLLFLPSSLTQSPTLRRIHIYCERLLSLSHTHTHRHTQAHVHAHIQTHTHICRQRRGERPTLSLWHHFIYQELRGICERWEKTSVYTAKL